MKAARDLMTSPAECLSSDETLVGILTDRDIVVQGVSKGLDLSIATVGEVVGDISKS